MIFKSSIPKLLRNLIHQRPLLGATNSSKHSETDHDHVDGSDAPSVSSVKGALRIPEYVAPRKALQLDGK